MINTNILQTSSIQYNKQNNESNKEYKLLLILEFVDFEKVFYSIKLKSIIKDLTIPYIKNKHLQIYH